MTDFEKIVAILCITEAIKQYGIPSSFCATIAISLGALFGYLEQPNELGILYGIAFGAVVTGGYTIVKQIGLDILNAIKKPSYLQWEHDEDRDV